MKTKLLLLSALFASFAGALSAVPPVVTIENTGNCIVDGANVGQPADAIANNASLAPAIQTALVAFVTKTKTDADAAVAAKESEKQAAITAAQAAVADTLAAKDAQIATLTAARDQLAADKAALQTLVQQLQTQLAAAQPPPAPQP